jgi:hypothetical protein
MKTTVKNAVQFNNIATNWVQGQNGIDTKLKYAVNRMIKRTDAIREKYMEDLEETRIDNCSVDDKGNILREENNAQLYKYTKEGLKTLNKRHREILATEVEIEPYFATQLPEELDAVVREIFTGFVIKEEEKPNDDE